MTTILQLASRVIRLVTLILSYWKFYVRAYIGQWFVKPVQAYDMRNGCVVSAKATMTTNFSSNNNILYERVCVIRGNVHRPDNIVRRMVSSEPSLLFLSDVDFKNLAIREKPHVLLAQLKLAAEFSSYHDITDVFCEYWPSFIHKGDGDYDGDGDRDVHNYHPTAAQFIMVLAMRNVISWKKAAMIVFMDDSHMDQGAFIRVLMSDLTVLTFCLPDEIRVPVE
jgi:hypothetical protein